MPVKAPPKQVKKKTRPSGRPRQSPAEKPKKAIVRKRAPAKAATTGNASGNTVIIDLSKNKNAKPRTTPVIPRQQVPQVISIQNPGNDALLRDIQFQMNKLNLTGTQPMQTLNTQSPVIPPPMPVVQQVQQTLPPISGIGSGRNLADIPVIPQPIASTPPRMEPTNLFGNDIFQATPREDEPGPSRGRQADQGEARGRPTEVLPKEDKKMSYEEIQQAMAAIPMEKKINPKTGKAEMKPKRGYGATFNELMKQMNAKGKTVRMKK